MRRSIGKQSSVEPVESVLKKKWKGKAADSGKRDTRANLDMPKYNPFPTKVSISLGGVRTPPNT